VWVGFTGVRGGQRITTGEFDDFSYCRHSATVATPYRRGSSARHGEKYNNQLARDGEATATSMDGATAMHWRRDGDYDVTATGRRRRTAVAGGSEDKDDHNGGGGGGDGHRRRSGHSSRDDHNNGNDSDSNNNDPTECL
jgi:hypothetical protein